MEARPARRHVTLGRPFRSVSSSGWRAREGRGCTIFRDSRPTHAGLPHLSERPPKIPCLTARAIWLWIAAAYLVVLLTTLWATGVLPPPNPPDVL